MSKSKPIKLPLFVVFLAYIFIVLWLTLFNREVGEHRSILTPFWEYAKVLHNEERSYYIKQIIGNLIMLMPFGFMLLWLFKLDLRKCLIISGCFSIFIEITQFITGRGLMEFDDVFNNTVGAVIGHLLFYGLVKKYRELQKRIKQ